MYRLIISLFALILTSLISACGASDALDQTDPESVAKTMIIAWRDHDTAAMSEVIHPNDAHEVRRLHESSTKEKDMLEWDMFNPAEGEYQDAQNWDGTLSDPKRDDDYLLYAFTDTNQYDERTVLVLEKIDENWYVYEKWYLKTADFNALPNWSD